MLESFRWYGTKDPVSLSDIRQAGASGVVSALHEVANGQVWEKSDILSHQKAIQKGGLDWVVVESVPIHEDIKQRKGLYKTYIENYKKTLENLAYCGIKKVCYNFMPVLDWTRTHLYYPLPDGSTALYFNSTAIAAFDMFILKRKGAEEEYTSSQFQKAKEYYASLSSKEKLTLTESIIAGLPGAEEGYSMDQFKVQLSHYQNISKAQLQEHLILFLESIIPTAEDCGIKMCIHPDDPPFSLFGIPRVVSSAEDLEQLFSAIPSRSNGLTFCTGSLGVLPENHLVHLFETYADRIHFLHLRSTKRKANGDFFEANHLEGDVDMFSIVKAILTEEDKRKAMGRPDWQIPMRPDHGHQMLDDLNKKTNPGYSAIGRLRGLAELRGLSLGLSKTLYKNRRYNEQDSVNGFL